jgi:cell division septal protein FtsQ
MTPTTDEQNRYEESRNRNKNRSASESNKRANRIIVWLFILIAVLMGILGTLLIYRFLS